MPHQPRLPYQPTSGAKRRMQVQFPGDDFEALRVLAQEHHRSINAEVVRAIHEHLEYLQTRDERTGLQRGDSASQIRLDGFDDEGAEPR